MAVASVVVASIVRMVLHPALGHEYEFTTLFLAVVFSAWVGGFWPAMLALVLDYVAAEGMLGFPRGAAFPEDSVGVLLYIIMGVGVGIVGETQRRAVRDLKMESEEREKTIGELGAEVKRREEAQEELRRSQIHLIELSSSLEERVKERTNELTVALQELESFTYSIAHDLRGPLRAVNATCKLIAEEGKDKPDESGQELLNSAMRAADFMNSFVDGLLDYARLARVPIHKSKIDLTKILESIRSEVSHETPDLTFDAQPGMELVSDLTLTETLFRELIDNSIKYKKPNNPCHIRIALKDDPDSSKITVSDDGIGFDMEYAAKIFEPFQKLHRSEDYPGAGIGLAKAKRIVERLGGITWAESSPDKGCSIHVDLPHRSQYEGRTVSAETLRILAGLRSVTPPWSLQSGLAASLGTNGVK